MRLKQDRWRMIAGLCFLLAMITFAARAVGPATNSITLSWKAGVNSIPFVHSVHSSTDASAPMPWTVLTNIPSTQTNLTLLVSKTACLYYVTCLSITTNAGVVVIRESDPTNVALDPWPNQGDSLSVK